MRNTADDKKKWIILVLCCLAACGNGGVNNAHGVFITPVAEGLGISQTTFSLITTITTVSGSFISLIVPRMVLRFKPKAVMAAGAVFGIGGYFLASRMKSVVALTLFLVMKRLSYHLMGTTVLLMIVHEWFVKDSGLASSIVTGCYGLAGAALSPVFAWGIENRSWRYGYLIASAFCLLMFLPPLAAPIRFTKSRIEEDETGQRAVMEESVLPYDRKSIPVLIVYALGVISYMNVAFGEYITSIAITKGMHLSVGALFASSLMVGNITSKLLNGWISDRIGATRTAALMCLVCTAGASVVMLSQDRTVLLIASFFFGALYSVSGLSLSLVNRELFGAVHFAEAFSRTTFVGSIVYAALYPLWGLSYDLTGSYTLTMTVTIGATVLIIPLLMYLDGKRRKEQKISETGSNPVS